MRTAVVVRHVAFENLGVLEPVLERRGWLLREFEVGADGVPVAEMRTADLAIVLGGPIGVGDAPRYPFVAHEISALADRLAQRGPTLGICLGAQLMAAALGAAVRPTGRTEIGYAPLTLTDAGRAGVLAPLDGLPVLHWHGDAFEIPEGARRLAATPGFPNQAFAVGGHALGLQFHLEADWRLIERWLIGHAHELATVGIDPGRIRTDAAAFGPALADRARQVIDAWLDGVE